MAATVFPTVAVEVCTVKITTSELGMTRDRFTQAALRRILGQRITWTRGVPFNLIRPLQLSISDFSESIATGATTDLVEYDNRRGSKARTAGGRPATSSPLLYSEDRLKPNGGSIGASGEGLAGEYLEIYEQLRFEVRPFGVSPDLIFRNNGGKRILVEVKTSTEKFPPVIPTALDLLDILAKTKLIRRGKYLAYVVAIRITNAATFSLRRLCLEET
jgi:hypothetical protein